MVVVSDLNKNFGGSTDLAKKRHRSADLHTPIHPPLHALDETADNATEL